MQGLIQSMQGKLPPPKISLPNPASFKYFPFMKYKNGQLPSQNEHPRLIPAWWGGKIFSPLSAV
jgi:hypothetical protein